MRLLISLWIPLIALSLYALFTPMLPNVTSYQWSLILIAIAIGNTLFSTLFSRGRLFLATYITLSLYLTHLSITPPTTLFIMIAYLFITLVPEKKVLSPHLAGYAIVLIILYSVLHFTPYVTSLLTLYPGVVQIGASISLSALLFLPLVTKEYDFTLFSALFTLTTIMLYTHNGEHTLLTSHYLSIPLLLIFIGLIASLHNVTFNDSLTQIKGRRALDQHLESLTGLYTLAMIDIDHFKKFNDTYGHESGDKVLQEVAKHLNHAPKCSAYRYGGEEFVLVYNSRNKEDSLPYADGVRKSIEKMRVTLKTAPKKKKKRSKKRRSQKSVKVTISIGLSDSKSVDKKEFEAVLKQADTNLYKAKKAGRNRVAL